MPLPSLSSIESDLISASLGGRASLIAEIQRKFAALDLDVGDREAVVAALSEKTAWEAPKWLAPAMIGGAVLAPAVGHGINYLANKIGDRREENWAAVSQHDPETAANPRARALFDFIHDTSPNLTSNPVVAGDLLKQLSSMPLMDVGTVGRLSEIGKNTRGNPSTSTPWYGQVAGNALEAGATGEKVDKTLGALGATPKQAGINWATPAMKTAGITSPFSAQTGSGTVLQQSDNAFNQQQQANPLPTFALDQVVRELIAMEQQLAMRQEAIAIREQQLMQAAQLHQGMGQAFQSEYGADPYAGAMDEAPAEDPAMAGADPSQDPAMAGADPAMAGADPAMAGSPAADPSQDPAMAGSPAADPSQDPAMAGSPTAGPSQDPAMAGADPSQDPAMAGAPAADPMMAAGPAVAAPGTPDPTTDPAGAAAELEAGLPSNNPEAGAPAVPPPEGMGADEHDHAVIEQGLDAGPNTAESVEGTPEDAQHDAANGVVEGTPEDQVADAELASVLNAGGHVAGQPDAGMASAAPAPAQGGGMTLQIPLPTLTITISTDGQIQPKLAERNDAVARAQAFLDSLSKD